MIINGNFNYHNNSLQSNSISFLSLNSNKNLFYLNLNSSSYNNGVSWSITNNNNINLTLRDFYDNTRLDYFSSIYTISTSPHIFINTLYHLTLRYIYITTTTRGICL